MGPTLADVRPPLRWMGGKFNSRHVLRELVGLSVSWSGRVVDPFFGGGSTLSLFPASRFTVSDSNDELMNFHVACRDDSAALKARVSRFEDSKEAFYATRRMYTEKTADEDNIERAARFLFLNRTSYGGIYRVNRQGVFNVPYGGGGRFKIDVLSAAIDAHASRLSRVDLSTSDFGDALGDISSGDLLFLDPPYFSPGRRTFTRYGPEVFDFASHGALATRARTSVEGGALAVATLPGSPEVLSLYAGWKLLSARFSRRLPAGEVMVVGGGSAWPGLGIEIPDNEAEIGRLISDAARPGERV